MDIFNFCSRGKTQKKAIDNRSLQEYKNNEFNPFEIEKIMMCAILQQVSYYPILFWNKDWKRRHKKMEKKKIERHIRSRRISLDSFELNNSYLETDCDFHEINLFSMPTSRDIEKVPFKKSDSLHDLLSFNENKNQKEYIIPYSNVATNFIDGKYELNTFPNKPIQFKIINSEYHIELILTIFITNQEVIFIPNIYCQEVLSYKKLKEIAPILLNDIFLKEDFIKYIFEFPFQKFFSFFYVGHHTSIFLAKELLNRLSRSFPENNAEIYLFQPLIFDDNDFWNDIFRMVNKQQAYILTFDNPSDINSAYIKYIHFIQLEWVKTIPSLNNETFEIKKCRECHTHQQSGLYHYHCCLMNLFGDIPHINRKRNIRAFVHLFF
jgi:hypothetical protein